MNDNENLTNSQKEAMEELRKRIVHEFTPKMLKETDDVLYRFLKARDFNVRAAESMLRKHLQDRVIYRIDTILHDYEPPKLMVEYIPINRLGFDKAGHLIRYFEIGAVDNKAVVTIWTFHEIILFFTYLIQQDFDKMREQSKKLGRTVNKYCFIINMDGLTLADATHKKSLEALMKGFTLFQDNYPEQIKCIYIINTSFYFSLAYSVIKACIASEVLKKIHIYSKEGWKEDLLKIIDADVLPAFLGGNRTDPDGDPQCNTFIVHGRQIPEELYKHKLKNPLSEQKNVKKLTVQRFSTSEILFHVYEPNSYLEWEFETKSKDIGFTLLYKDTFKEKSKLVELIPKERIETRYSSETGIYKCDKVGTYIIVFDNSYSWIFSKEIYYRMRLKKPNELENELTQ